MKYREIMKFWKEDDLFRYSYDDIQIFNFPESINYFFVNIGVIINDEFIKKCNYKFLNKLLWKILMVKIM
ncbi:hypothetical protein [uncultured Clostridium sp.]|uniref:hypothetical protein n=1 Tax=uncultured Clostridium sp. TaxID=59620 RepID=UPI0025EA9C0B|nr:hypothetical protein [uncultured Clostridium sp.]